MPRSTKCPVCGEEYSVLRSSTDCALCHRTACSSCCRPSPLNPSSKICISCARKQQKVDDSNDDRPKWLREAQALRQNQPGSSTDSFPHKSNPSTNPSFSSGAKKSHAMDDRPKWLREAQEQRASASSTVASHSSPPDQAIESRLAKLKGELNEMKPIATDDELTDRMARLRDQDPKEYRASRQPDHSILRPQPRRTEAEEIEELVAQMKERATLDDGDEDLIKELEERLNRLKADTAALGIPAMPSVTSSPRTRPRDFSPSGGTGKSSKKKQRVVAAVEDDSDEEVDRITKLLTEKLPQMEEGAEGSGEDEAFCVICPEDPTLICVDCENDKYCDRCFRECHREWAAMDHRVKRLPR